MSESVNGLDVETIQGLADGWDPTQGATTDPAWSGSGAGSDISILKTIASRLLTSVSWLEFNAVSVAASGASGSTITGITRSSGAVFGVAAFYSYFQVVIYTTVAGQIVVYNQGSNAPNQVLVQQVPVGPSTFKIPAFGPGFVVTFTNTTSNPGTVTMETGFTQT